MTKGEHEVVNAARKLLSRLQAMPGITDAQYEEIDAIETKLWDLLYPGMGTGAPSREAGK